MAENVKVIVRCRPVNKKEADTKLKIIVRTENCAILLENPTDRTAPSKVFTFDNAYDSKAPTEAIYNDICYSLVESVLEGYNGTIFAYGQTGCGKSHTMQGPSDFFDKTTKTDRILSQRGIISRSFDHIFEAISVSSDCRFLAQVSFLEIYNENIRDLLNPNLSSVSLQLKELPDEGVVVQNLSKHTVQNSTECEEFLKLGSQNRVVGATLMNATSSRSHSIFTISLEQINDHLNIEKTSIKKGKLNLVDLAGSERQNKTGATGDRLKEATKINLSLSALGNVISALVDGKTKHIPYRDAKLTRLLQDSLGGNTRTLMIACISPSEYNYDETLSTLRYASRAKNIHNKPKINEDPKDTMLREYQEEINKLKKLLENNQQMYDQPKIVEPIENSEITERIEILKKSLIGGEKANDEQLKEKRIKKKIAAHNRMIVLNELLKRIDQTEDRDLLKSHYTDIHQELIDKTENFKRQKQKIRALEREITDLQSEFQLDRADYLETIRRLEKNIKFYQQLIDKSLPVLRKDGRFWDVDVIKSQSTWNDDLQKWKFPDESLTRLKLPPAVDVFRTGRESTSLTAPGRLERSASITSISSNCSEIDVCKEENDFLIKKLQNSDSTSIVESYFRPRRATELITQNRGFTSWKNQSPNWTNGGNLLLNRTWCAGVSNQDARGSQ